MQTYKILVTGGAGFIGSNLVEKLLSLPQVSKVRVLDNLATGKMENIQPFLEDERFEFLEGDIRDFTTCQKAVDGIDKITHQA
ncbi:MAG: LPS biosynthesis protein WbpP, partial [Thalassobius sp.]|nr:LPS biosynthesis protein WbpP [Thalassovita sp.]